MLSLPAVVGEVSRSACPPWWAKAFGVGVPKPPTLLLSAVWKPPLLGNLAHPKAFLIFFLTRSNRISYKHVRLIHIANPLRQLKSGTDRLTTSNKERK